MGDVGAPLPPGDQEAAGRIVASLAQSTCLRYTQMPTALPCRELEKTVDGDSQSLWARLPTTLVQRGTLRRSYISLSMAKAIMITTLPVPAGVPVWAYLAQRLIAVPDVTARPRPAAEVR